MLGTALVVRVRILGEDLLDPAVSDPVLALHALRVDAQQDFDAVTGPLGDLGGRDAAVKPQGYRGVPQVVGAGGKRRGDLFGREGQDAGLLSDLGIGGRGHGFTALAVEDPAAFTDPVGRDVLPQDCH